MFDRKPEYNNREKHSLTSEVRHILRDELDWELKNLRDDITKLNQKIEVSQRVSYYVDEYWKETDTTERVQKTISAQELLQELIDTGVITINHNKEREVKIDHD